MSGRDHSNNTPRPAEKTSAINALSSFPWEHEQREAATRHQMNNGTRMIL